MKNKIEATFSSDSAHNDLSVPSLHNSSIFFFPNIQPQMYTSFLFSSNQLSQFYPTLFSRYKSSFTRQHIPEDFSSLGVTKMQNLSNERYTIEENSGGLQERQVYRQQGGRRSCRKTRDVDRHVASFRTRLRPWPSNIEVLYGLLAKLEEYSAITFVAQFRERVVQSNVLCSSVEVANLN